MSDVYRQVGKGVTFRRALLADGLDMLPAILTTWLAWGPGPASAPVAFALGFLIWLLNPCLLRATTTTSLGGLASDLTWVTRNRRNAPFGAQFAFALYSQTYLVFIGTFWVLLALAMPWRLLNPNTFKAFVTPNTELFGVIMERRR